MQQEFQIQSSLDTKTSGEPIEILLVEDNAGDARLLQEALNEIDATEHAASLTRRLLTFSHKQVMQPRWLDLNEVVNQINQMLHRLLGEDMRLEFDRSPNLPAIHADAGMLEQIIINLAINARDAMPNGGALEIGTKRCRIEEDYVQRHPEARPGTFVCLSVSDAGCGMDQETLSRIFEPFFTTKEPGKGTGLGLATIYGIVQLHQGWIEVSSRLNHGTTCDVYLPACDGPVEPIRESELKEKACHGKETILVVEDDPALRAMVREILECYGYRILEASNGVQALDVWKQSRREIDLLFTDMIMPEGMTGLELARRLVDDQKDLKVIFSSGHSSELMGRDLILRDGVNFLQKPYNAQTLAQNIRQCLDQIDPPIPTST